MFFAAERCINAPLVMKALAFRLRGRAHNKAQTASLKGESGRSIFSNRRSNHESVSTSWLGSWLINY